MVVFKNVKNVKNVHRMVVFAIRCINVTVQQHTPVQERSAH